MKSRKMSKFASVHRTELQLIQAEPARKAKQKVDENHYPALSLKGFKLVLRRSLTAGLESYSAAVSQLTTCLRNQEMGRRLKARLCGSRKSFLRYPDPLYGNVYLIQKPLGQVDPKRDFTNRGVSLIGRVILKFYKMPSQKFFNSVFLLGSDLHDELSTVNAHQRNLRTTGAQMLRFGYSTAVANPVDPKIIKLRTAQKTNQMVFEDYAKNLPSDA